MIIEITKLDKYSFIFGRLLIIIGFIIWIINNIYFGWNFEPINGTERMFDIISNLIIVFGFVLWSSTAVKIYNVFMDSLLIEK